MSNDSHMQEIAVAGRVVEEVKNHYASLRNNCEVLSPKRQIDFTLYLLSLSDPQVN